MCCRLPDAFDVDGSVDFVEAAAHPHNRVCLSHFTRCKAKECTHGLGRLRLLTAA